MNNQPSRHRRVLAVLAGLAVAAAVSVAAPAAADAREAGPAKVTVHVQQHVPTVSHNSIWDW